MRVVMFALLSLALMAGPSLASLAQPDAGLWLAFTSGRSGTTDIYKLNVLTRGVKQLTATPDPESEPAWSWDGSLIAYTRDDDVWTMQANGSGQANRTPGAGSHERFPFWLPDGRLGFTSDRTGTEELYLLATPDWTPLQIQGRRAAVSFDGRRVCYTRDLEVYWAPLRNPTHERNISQWDGSDHGCVWKPQDSFFLLIHSHRPYKQDRSGRLWLADRTGVFYSPPLTDGTDDTEGDTSPAWHESGWIAWSRHIGCVPDPPCSRQPEKMELFARDPSGAVTQLTDNAVEDSEPHFKP